MGKEIHLSCRQTCPYRINPLPCPGCLIMRNDEKTPEQIAAFLEFDRMIRTTTRLNYKRLYIYEDGETVGHVYALDEYGNRIRKVAEVHHGTFVIFEKEQPG